MKKVVLYSILATGLGVGIYLCIDEPTPKTASKTHSPNEVSADSFTRITLERDELRERVTSLQEELTRVNREVSEIASHTKDVTGRLKGQDSSAAAGSGKAEPIDPFAKSVQALAGRAAELNQQFQKVAGTDIPELQFLSEGDWINLAKNANFDSEEAIRKTLADVRQQAKRNFAPSISGAIAKFAEANGGQIPSDSMQLKSYFNPPVEDSVLQRYKVIDPATHPELRLLQTPIFQEIAPVDPKNDTLMFVGPNGHSLVPVVNPAATGTVK